MAKRQSLLIAACIVLAFLALVIPSFSVRLILAGVMLVVGVVWVVSRRGSANVNNLAVEQTNAPENFEVRSLLEATMTGMREGLLVVNRDMRVVASNPAARKLFNPTVPSSSHND